MRNRTILALLAGAALSLPTAAAAQQWGRGSIPRDGACFYERPYFRGNYFCAASGERFGAIPWWMGDRIASIRVFGGGGVSLFADRGFVGQRMRVDYSVPDLLQEGWNDRISSMRVWNRSFFGPDQRGYERPWYYRNDAPPVYEPEYTQPGAGFEFEYRGRPDQGRPDQDRQYRDRSDRDRARQSVAPMTRAQAEQVVRNAYLSILKREPDHPGSDGYVDAVFNKGASQADIERELLKSDEYRRMRK